jgi:hypothetical protein
MKILLNECLNRRIRMLDGQWQGIALASDRCVYFFAGSHRPDLGAPFFRYVPEAAGPGRVELICDNISRVCGEDPARVPAQGKVHSDILEHQGRLYFATHLSDYSPEGRRAYTGAHLLSYELAGGRFRDYGVVRPNYTNYSGIGLDRARNRMYFYVTPFADAPESDGPHMFTVDLAAGAKRDLGLIVPWTVRQNPPGHIIDHTDHLRGQSVPHLHVDRRGDCWFTIRDSGAAEQGLWVARGDSGRLERFPRALPGNATRWLATAPLDDERALALFADGAWLFDPARFDGSPRAFTLLKKIDRDLGWSSLGLGGGRFFWNCRDDKERHRTQFPVMRLYSASVTAPERTVEHGHVRDAEGRIPRGLSGIAADDAGRVYLAGRWHVLESEYDSLGVDRHGHIVAAFFTVLDISEDL